MTVEARGIAVVVAGLLGWGGAAAAAMLPAPDGSAATMPPVHRSIEVVERTLPAVNYETRRGFPTKIDFAGTALLPGARGQAEVENKKGYTTVEVQFDDLPEASSVDKEYLTYVLWAITPAGRATNLGEVVRRGGKGMESKLNVTTELQSFGLMVTAEPYFAVSRPSDAVVLENVLRADTAGKVDRVEARYELLEPGHYPPDPGLAAAAPVVGEWSPLDLHQARHAIAIARGAGAELHAAETLARAGELAAEAERLGASKSDRRRLQTAAREAVQRAEDARLIAVKRAEEERLARERAEAAAREAAARAEAEEEARRRQEAEAAATAARRKSEAAEGRRKAAEQQRAEEARRRSRAEAAAASARAAAAAAEKQRAEAAKREAAALATSEAEARRREQAEAQAAAARTAAEAAERQRTEAEQKRAEAERKQAEAETLVLETRSELKKQLDLVLETRDTARGLVVNLPDILFDTNQAEIKPAGREQLAKVAGILLSTPGLRFEVEGHADSQSDEAHNQALSERRAGTVRDYLVAQGVAAGAIQARGYGESRPVADNATAEGRQRNRRVDLVVSGEAIGTAAASSAVGQP